MYDHKIGYYSGFCNTENGASYLYGGFQKRSSPCYSCPIKGPQASQTPYIYGGLKDQGVPLCRSQAWFATGGPRKTLCISEQAMAAKSLNMGDSNDADTPFSLGCVFRATWLRL